MNDYSMGAMEALSWARARLKQCISLGEFKVARDEVNETLLRLTSGVAVNFGDRLELLRDS